MLIAPNRSVEIAVRYAFVPLLAIVGGGAIVALAPISKPGVVVVVFAALVVSFVAEWVVPFEEAWNRSRDDRMRDAVHAIVNESSTAVGVLTVPAVVGVAPTFVSWPDGVPFLLQVLFAVVVLDIGITVVHWWSHRNDWLWRFHAVHHSVSRMYGFNGLVKHPVHQAIETAAGLFLLIWDRLLGTFADPAGRSVAVDELGVAGRSAYPVGYVDQLREPFRRTIRTDRLNA